MTEAEKSRLASIAGQSLYASGVNSDAIRYSWKIFQRHLRPGSILELGPAEGVMTALLCETGRPIVAVEGSKDFCADLVRRFPAIRVVRSFITQ